MVIINDKKKCCGCGACYNSCPKNAIKMVENKEGFKYPIIDKEKCINCGLCKKVCPITNKDNLKSNYDNPKLYAAWSTDSHNRKTSSSGGLFYEIAKYIILKNGIVIGAGYDKEHNVIHKIVSSEEELIELKGSKYVQSDIGDIYFKAKKNISKGTLVLFVGTPCQVAGLYCYLKNTNYDNLYTIDLVCHGVPSPKVYRKYLKELEIKNKSKIKNINFRDKTNGWKKYSLNINFDNCLSYNNISYNDIYIQCFLSNICLRLSCYECIFSKIPRVADITLGDFWGIGNKDKSLDNDDGTSELLVNSSKASYLINCISDNLFIKEENLNFGIEVNPCLVNPAKKNKNRNLFFENLDKYELVVLQKKFFPKKNILKRLLNLLIRIFSRIIKIVRSIINDKK